MSRPLYVFRDRALDGPANMARDEYLLYCDQLRPASLRLYAWDPPTISLGYFQRYSDLARLPEELRELAVVRRATGGGAILHDREVTYCLVLDDSVPVASQPPAALYRLVHRCWQEALAGDLPEVQLGADHLPGPTARHGPFFCFHQPGRFDLIMDGHKLLGSAQRRIPGRVLQHGSLLLGRRFRAHPGADLGQPPEDRVHRWIDLFLRRLAAALSLELRPAGWSAEALADVAARRQRYASPTWTRRW